MIRLKTYVVLVLSVFGVVSAFAQAPLNDSLNYAIPMCPNIEYEGTNKLATDSPWETGTDMFENACFDTISNSVWFKFKTNFTGGHVQVRFDNISCLLAAGKGDSIEASIVDPFFNPNDTLEAYLVSDCNQGGNGEEFVINTAFTLKPLKEYYVVIDGLEPHNGGAPSECDFSLTVSGPGSNIDIITDPENASRSLIKGERVLVRALGADGDPNNVSWTPVLSSQGARIIQNENSPSTDVYPEDESTTYYVRSENSFAGTDVRCFMRDSITFYVDEELTPFNTFTPNGDGVNDLWEIPKIDDTEEFQSAEVTVFDRWGQIVYKKVGYRNAQGWDGTYNGQPLPEATYYWTINLNDIRKNNHTYTGSVTIIR